MSGILENQMKKLTKGFSEVSNEIYHADTEYVSSSVLKTILTKGFSEVSNEIYHADTEYVSSSVLKTILKDIGDYKKQYIDGEKKSFSNREALDFGSYLHALILEPHLVDVEFQVFSGLQKEGPEWDDFVENKLDPTKILIMGSQQTIAKKLLENYYKKEIYQEDGSSMLLNQMFVGGKAEESLCTELDGVKVKVRFDYRKENVKYLVPKGADINDPSVRTLVEMVYENNSFINDVKFQRIKEWRRSVRPLDTTLVLPYT
jgi:hypothetical protein